MEKIELQEIIDACEEAHSDYIKLFRPLLGYEDEVELYRGIDDSMEETLEEIETRVGLAFPVDFLQLYLIANGGKYFDVTLYYLTSDKDDVNGLYYKNMDKSLREEYNIPKEALIVGESKDGDIIFIGLDEEGYYTCYAWDKETKDVSVVYHYILELLILEADYHTNAFEINYSEDEEV